MQEENKGDKIRRVLQLYAKLSDGYVINKAEEAAYYGVTERSITRDIDDIRNFLDEDSERTGIVNNVVYDRMAKGYRLETLYKIRLQNSEVLALCKILLDSRAFTKNEMVSMLDKLITCCVPREILLIPLRLLQMICPAILRMFSILRIKWMQKKKSLIS